MFRILSLLTLLTLSASSVARAATPSGRAFAGTNFGLAFVNNGLNAGFGIGFSGGYYFLEFPDGELAGGMKFNYSFHDHADNLLFGGEAIVRSHHLPGAFASFLLGLNQVNSDGGGSSASFALGMSGGYDYMLPIPYPISLGGRMDLNLAFDDNTLVNFNVFVNGKYWF